MDGDHKLQLSGRSHGIMRLRPACCAVLVINKDQLQLKLDHGQDSYERPGRKAHSSGWAVADLCGGVSCGSWEKGLALGEPQSRGLDQLWSRLILVSPMVLFSKADSSGETSP